jgi:SAM-dependent methyltransferase
MKSGPDSIRVRDGELLNAPCTLAPQDSLYSFLMGKGAPLRWLENKLLARHLRGCGIEIGALWRKFPVPRPARVYYIDRISEADLQQHYAEVSSPILAPDVVADATHLPFAPGMLDFIIASHVLEHLPFPLDALHHWHDVLRPGGVLLLKIPDKRYTFDHNRQRTRLQHLIDEQINRSAFDKHDHFADWVEHVIGRPRGTPEFDAQLSELLAADYSIHYHAWTDEDIREIADYSRNTMHLDWQSIVFWRAHFYRKECVLMLRRNS